MSEERPYNVIPFTPMRKVIAARMVEAKQTIPHFRMSADIEVSTLLAFREAYNKDNPDVKISINDLLIKACAKALMDVPEINIQIVGEEIHQYKQADISIIVAVEGGLSTPVIKNANQKSVEVINHEVKNLAQRAMAGKLKVQDIMGGTFSISNLGMYGVERFDAIINPPQGAILAVGSMEERSVVSDGEITIGKCLPVCLSMDHRAIDGVIGARFLQALRVALGNYGQEFII